ncbi:MAG: FKBP-type peptidyl-prolyl cis-trans isomerase [Gemmatimonadaceae bacterium]
MNSFRRYSLHVSRYAIIASIACASMIGCLHAPQNSATSSASQNTKPKATIPPVKGKPVLAFAQRHVDIQLGAGESVRPNACFYAHYTGWLTDGTQFDSSRDTTRSGQPKPPISFAQGAKRVITGWDAGFEGMKVGGKRRLFIPYQLGYGELGRPPAIPAKSELIFDVELMAVADTLPRAQPVPRGQSAPPPQCPAWTAVKVTR